MLRLGKLSVGRDEVKVTKGMFDWAHPDHNDSSVFRFCV